MTDLHAAIMNLKPPKGIAFDYQTGFQDARHAAAELARAALSAPAGWKLVPIEPTPEMVKAGWIDKDDVNPDEIWAAMLDAAPSPQEPK